MGYMAHHAVIITISGYVFDEAYRNRDRSPGSVWEHDPQMPDLDAFKAALPEHFQPMLVGPIPSAANDERTVFFAPDGSKEGWDTSDQGDEIRRHLIELFSGCYDDGSSPFDVVEVRFGGDDPHLVHARDPYAERRES